MEAVDQESEPPAAQPRSLVRIPGRKGATGQKSEPAAQAAQGARREGGSWTRQNSRAPQSRSISRRSFIATATAAAATAAASAATAAAALAGCSGADVIDAVTGKTGDKAADKPVAGSTFAFDTYCTFTVYGDDAAPAKLAQACARFDGLFDLYKDTSDIARINAAGGEATQVDADTVDVITRAIEFAEKTDGLFDITIGAVSTLWDFDKHVRPADDVIAAALPHVSWRNVRVEADAKTVQLTDPESKLDLGGIAKGYVADRLCDLLRAETKATAAVISLGGNIAYFGAKPDGGTWDTGIRDPNDPGGSKTVGTAHVKGGSLVTSGLYERTFEQDGITYWHILDPRTGMPVQTDVVSDTIYCPSSTEADALSTALFVAGTRRGAEIVDGFDGTAAYFIKQDGSTVESSRWQELTDFNA